MGLLTFEQRKILRAIKERYPDGIWKRDLKRMFPVNNMDPYIQALWMKGHITYETRRRWFFWEGTWIRSLGN